MLMFITRLDRIVSMACYAYIFISIFTFIHSFFPPVFPSVTDSRKPQITSTEEPKNIPIGDGSRVAMTIRDNVTALPNTTISIACPTNGIPRPRVTWKMNGEMLHLDQDHLVEESGTLTVQRVTESALYTCSVENEVGEDAASSSVVIIGRTYNICYIRFSVLKLSSFM